MKRIIYQCDQIGLTVYALLSIEDPDSADHGKMVLVATGAAETLQVAHWDDYDLPMGESPASSGFYCVDLPAPIAARFFRIQIRSQAAGTPAVTDDLLAEGCCQGNWDRQNGEEHTMRRRGGNVEPSREQ